MSVIIGPTVVVMCCLPLAISLVHEQHECDYRTDSRSNVLFTAGYIAGA